MVSDAFVHSIAIVCNRSLWHDHGSTGKLGELFVDDAVWTYRFSFPWLTSELRLMSTFDTEHFSARLYSA
jgi:hypothetical protein